MKLIDKSALVAEIDKILDYAEEHWDTDYVKGAWWFVDKLQQAINTFEVKEVDLEKIIEQTYHDRSVTDTSDMDHVTYENIASYFFELGIKTTQKGE